MSEVLKQKIRKDLSRWSRKLLLTIGLEDIGKQLVGEEKWQSLYPVWRDAEQVRTPDFDPDEVPEPDIQDYTSADLSHVDPSETPEEEGGEEKSEILENFFHLLPYWYIINRAFGSQVGLGTGNVSEDLKNSTNPLIDAFDANQRLNSLILFESLKQHYAQAGLQPVLPSSFNDIQNFPFLPSDVSNPSKIANNSHPVSADSKQNEAFHLGIHGLLPSNQEDRDQPLDLTQKNKKLDRLLETPKQWSADVNSSRSHHATETKVPKASCRPNVRPGKGYTSQELEAALRDIQSGKLGTRRAAVIYGIPRSTLRNKVYKMGKDRSRPYFRQKNAATNNNVDGSEENSQTKVSIIPGPDTHDLLGSLGTNESGVQHNLASNLLLPLTTLPSIPSSHSQGNILLDGPRVKQEMCDSDEDVSVMKSEEEISHEKKVLKEWLRSKLSRQQPLLTQSSANDNGCGSRNSPALSDSSDNSDASRPESRKEVILKIPSLINNKSSLGRVISRKKLKRRMTKDADTTNAAQHDISLMTSFGGETSSTSTHPFGGNNSPHGWKHFKIEDGNESMDDGESEDKPSSLNVASRDNNGSWDYCSGKDLPSSTTVTSNSNLDSSASETNGKKSRPKRGKYRNYDRDALLKAVRAVQAGEMSVHRAGSFYGVPHSTLEYKVKERHLLRRPKRKGTESPKPSQKSSPESSLSGSDPQMSRNTTGTPSGEGNSLPLTADLRESLSRYLNIGQALGGNQSTSSGLPIGNGRSILNHGKIHDDVLLRENQIDNHSVGLGRGMISPFLNLFNLDDLIRQNLDSSSLLDLTKKS